LGNLSVSSSRFSKKLITNHYALVPPKSDPYFKVRMMEDGTMVPDESADGSRAFPEWVWEKYGPKEADED